MFYDFQILIYKNNNFLLLPYLLISTPMRLTISKKQFESRNQNGKSFTIYINFFTSILTIGIFLKYNLMNLVNIQCFRITYCLNSIQFNYL